MSWWTARYTQRPAANRPGARIAWDELSRRAALRDPPRVLVKLWYAPEMYSWNAYLNDVDGEPYEAFIDMDMLEVRDRRNNPHKYREPSDER